MTELTVSVLEEYLRDHYGTTVPEQSLFMKLVEEIGEVAELLNQRAGRKMMASEDASSARLAEELADVIHYLAAVNQLDLTKSILEKDKRASVKYGREINLLEFIEKRK
ncbi:nucleotide pyrophosphohydrolase [Streptococcus suis]|uniref:MazG nucleotide pyrophosphohydrolase domain-containing protein n=1 Tax=Streptococcus suis TaxID=1307 RepID=UPI0019326E6B|nr:MazG nucleotide pyrophosphohydrolase domain-containing protein [Streptococcus suis]MBM0273094.1 nucleotide pyrophosphohydrolase [Streptococcus suis]NRH15660.1 nucleotide pyrophosphohydrolase [Streptococcus suis]HEM2805597.1 nucleotide pyrophosphohydrolase [Streptococcus suis]HEM2821789.1 nucleotide pyrophosphohydrolase [Streptococcus suis]HEM2838976.1 nucleotide pyrophosphohydrolase [Streptococcus suis]